MGYVESLFSLNKKLVILTGGAGILASTMAKGLAKAGASIILLDINEESLQRQVSELRFIKSDVEGYVCNVLNENDVQRISDTICKQHSTIDILINAAGGNTQRSTIGIDKTVFDLTVDDHKQAFDLNFWGTVIPTLVFGKQMAKQRRGSIINISSMASFRTISRVMGYSAAKAAVDNFTRWMAVELAKKFGNGIRVNAIAPGFLITEQNRALLINPDGSPTKRGNDVLAMTPFKRFGDPEELIGTVLWLASDASSFVTGTVIPIDGGFSINSGV
ncbi:MAG: SDR family oxidoreductase [Bacteroidetes bacterium]|nr:SDR family oxidoreductase [Bacteroidota bacterium]